MLKLNFKTVDTDGLRKRLALFYFQEGKEIIR